MSRCLHNLVQILNIFDQKSRNFFLNSFWRNPSIEHSIHTRLNFVKLITLFPKLKIHHKVKLKERTGREKKYNCVASGHVKRENFMQCFD